MPDNDDGTIAELKAIHPALLVHHTPPAIFLGRKRIGFWDTDSMALSFLPLIAAHNM